MKKKNSVELYGALLVFSNLSQSDQQNFISELNEFLMVSPQIRHRLVEEWGRIHSQLLDENPVR